MAASSKRTRGLACFWLFTAFILSCIEPSTFYTRRITRLIFNFLNYKIVDGIVGNIHEKYISVMFIDVY